MNKILYLVTNLKNSGPTNQLYNIISNLDRDTYTPVILVISQRERHTRYHDFSLLGVDIHVLKESPCKLLTLNKKKLRKTVQKINPDILHTVGLRPDLHAVIDFKTIPSISTVRNCIELDYLPRYGYLYGKLLAWIHIKAIKKIGTVVGCSQTVSEYLKHVHGISSSVIQNGVDTRIFSPAAFHEKRELRKKIGLPENKFIFIAVGRVGARKNQGQLIRCFQEVFGDEALLLIVGKVESLDESIRIDKNRVTFIGYVTNTNEFLRASDVFVTTSKSEGLPNSVLEAMACRLPVLTSNIEPHKEIFHMNPRIGVMYDLKSDDDLKNALVTLYQSEELEQMADESYKTAQLDFSSHSMSRKYQHLYEEILANEPHMKELSQ